jgi:disulfide bond formation protein DsbB
VRCDEAAWRLLGLSFAGWNVVTSLLLAGGCAVAAVRTLRR